MEQKPSFLTKKECKWITAQFDLHAEVVDAVKLDGGISSLIYLVIVKHAGKRNKFVLRMVDNQEWLKEEGDIIEHEAASLYQAAESKTIVPTCMATDEKAVSCRYPALLMSYLPGDVFLRPTDMYSWLCELAKALHAIHQVPPADFRWRYHPYANVHDLKIPSWTKEPATWEKAFAYVQQAMPVYKQTFIHRDFHPNNVLFNGGKVIGVVDWVNACIGPAGVDVGHCRWNLAMIHGIEAANTFLQTYIQFAGEHFRYDVYWDLSSLLDVLADPLEVYAGWIAFGKCDVTAKTMAVCMDEYVKQLVGQIPSNEK